MKLHVILYIAGTVISVIGTLTLLAAWVAQQRYNERKADADRVAAERSADRLVERVTRATSPREQLDAIQDELARRGVQPLASPTKRDSPPADIGNVIQEIMRRLPHEVREQEERKVEALVAESHAQARAEALDTAIRPRFLSLVALVHDVISKAASQGLVELTGEPTTMEVPNRLMYTAFALEQAGLDLEQPDIASVFPFRNMTWRGHLKLGVVKSPDGLARPWDVPTDVYYSMLRLQQLGRDGEVTLVTAFFHHETSELSIHLNARGTVRKETEERIDQLSKSHSGIDLVSRVVLELLAEARLTYMTHDNSPG